jgi:hypothetical protein
MPIILSSPKSTLAYSVIVHAKRAAAHQHRRYCPPAMVIADEAFEVQPIEAPLANKWVF